MKTIALFGGTGFVGDRIKDKLLESRYRIRMLVRDADYARDLKLAGAIETVKGSIDDAAAVMATLENCDACIVATGARSKSLADMDAIVTGTQYIIRAMHAQQVKRLIKLSGVSVRIAGEPFPLPRRLLDIGLKLAMPNPSKSKYLEQDLIEASGLDWTVVRPPVVVLDAINKTFATHENQYLGLKVNRDDLSGFIIEQIESDQWLRKSPIVGYR